MLKSKNTVSVNDYIIILRERAANLRIILRRKNVAEITKSDLTLNAICNCEIDYVRDVVEIFERNPQKNLSVVYTPFVFDFVVKYSFGKTINIIFPRIDNFEVLFSIEFNEKIP